MKDDDRPVLDRQSTEHAPDLVSIRERGARVGVRGYRDNGQGNPIASPISSLLRDGTEEDSVQPSVEPLRIPQLWQITPAANKGFLNGVRRPVVVPEDQPRHPVHGVDGLGDEDVVRVPVPAPRSSHQLGLGHWSLVDVDQIVRSIVLLVGPGRKTFKKDGPSAEELLREVSDDAL